MLDIRGSVDAIIQISVLKRVHLSLGLGFVIRSTISDTQTFKFCS